MLVIYIIIFFSAGGNGITSPNAVGVLQWVPLWDNAAFLLLDKVNKKTIKKTTPFSQEYHKNNIVFIFYLYYFY